MDDIIRTVFTAVLWTLASSHEDHKNFTIKSGQNITLPCRASNTSFIAVEWSRFDLKPEYVLLSRDGHFDPHSQHLSFMNRVDLQERKMKDGDVSLILKNMKIDDTGTYECRVFMEETRSWKSISIIYLSVVDPPGPPVENRPVGLIIGVIVGLSAVVIFVACLIYKNPEKRQNIFLVPSCHERIRHFCRRAEAHVTSAVI